MFEGSIMYIIFCVMPGGHVIRLAGEYAHIDNAVREATYHAEYSPPSITFEVYANRASAMGERQWSSKAKS